MVRSSFCWLLGTVTLDHVPFQVVSDLPRLAGGPIKPTGLAGHPAVDSAITEVFRHRIND
jgi:hypothetical protein